VAPPYYCIIVALTGTSYISGKLKLRFSLMEGKKIKQGMDAVSPEEKLELRHLTITKSD
jgi:hypothetical protein